jgi:hypothetical protein
MLPVQHSDDILTAVKHTPPVQPSALVQELPEHGPFFLVNGVFTVVLTATLLVAVKATTIWAFHASVATPHVGVADLGYMWGLLVGCLVFFGSTVLLVMLDAPAGWHADNLNAYLFALVGLLLHAVTVLAACAGDDAVGCQYMYPVSPLRTVDATVHCALVAVLCLTSLTLNLSLGWCRRYILAYFAFGGCLFAAFAVLSQWLALHWALSESCGGTDARIRTRWGSDSVSAAFAALAVPAFILLLFLCENTWTRWGSVSDEDDGDGSPGQRDLDIETYQSKSGVVASVRSLLHVAAGLAVVPLSLVLQTKGSISASVCWCVVSLAAVATASCLALWAYKPALKMWLQVFGSDIAAWRRGRRATAGVGKKQPSADREMPPLVSSTAPAPASAATASASFMSLQNYYRGGRPIADKSKYY